MPAVMLNVNVEQRKSDNPVAKCCYLRSIAFDLAKMEPCVLQK